jgi:hypothetical protein
VRDGSLDDVVAVWMDHIVEEHRGRNPGDNEAAVYFAMLKHGVTGLLAAHQRFKPDTDYRKEVGEVLRTVRDCLGAPDRGEVEPERPEPGTEELEAAAASAAHPPEGKYARYWESDAWRQDFYTSFSRWFWDMKDYAIPAGRRKMDFLWDVGEVWIATGAAALVYYAKDDRPRWKAVADMMRECADLVEKDGLRSLSWGRWGRYAPANHEAKA